MGPPRRQYDRLRGVALECRLDWLRDCRGDAVIMAQTDRTEPRAVEETNTRRRDWVLLTAGSLLTICLLAISAELLSRWLYPSTQIGFQNCFTMNDPTGGAAVKPNSVCWEQIP